MRVAVVEVRLQEVVAQLLETEGQEEAEQDPLPRKELPELLIQVVVVVVKVTTLALLHLLLLAALVLSSSSAINKVNHERQLSRKHYYQISAIPIDHAGIGHLDSTAGSASYQSWRMAWRTY
jgi:hypothetical protein